MSTCCKYSDKNTLAYLRMEALSILHINREKVSFKESIIFEEILSIMTLEDKCGACQVFLFLTDFYGVIEIHMAFSADAKI